MNDIEAINLATPEWDLDAARRLTTDDLLIQMEKEINIVLAKVVSEANAISRIESLQVRWLNIPSKLHNPYKTIGHWRIYATRKKA